MAVPVTLYATSRPSDPHDISIATIAMMTPVRNVFMRPPRLVEAFSKTFVVLASALTCHGSLCVCRPSIRSSASLAVTSVVVHENFESLTSGDRKIITNVVDKQFTDLDDFQKIGSEHLRREVA